MIGQWLTPRLKRLFGALDSFGVLDYAQPWLSGMGLILMFHRVVTPRSRVFDQSLAVDSDSLDRILGYIRHRDWDIISADQLHDRLADGSNRRPFVCLTFDDGYADNLNIALPVFRRHQAPFCVNVTVGYINRTTPMWWNALEELLSHRNEMEFCGSGQTELIKLETWDEKLAAYWRFRSVLHQDVDARRPPLGNTWTLNGVDPQALTDRFFMTWAELRELARDPLVQIGAHTLPHPSLKQLSENEAGDEIEKSRAILQEKLSVAVDHFAYPFGSPNNCGPREFRLVKELKFKTAVTTRWCNIFPAHKKHLSSLPRKLVWYDDVSEPTLRARLFGEDLALKPWRRVVLD
jgi:peptidoglycan/xylan/chitin deacetylase (PgdA/CDA1 family)